MKKFKKQTVDGNYAATHVAYAFSDVAAIYPITPSSTMGEYADAWASQGKKNLFGEIVDVVEMQSEGGAAGAVHGALSAGAFTTTFTASQGLMLMLPNMHKIAGEMLPTVFHVSARSLATQSLSIFGDHSDVMSARNTGFALVAASSVQEIMDLAVVSHLATLEAKVPFLNFFDGFRNSHEIQKIEIIDDDTLKELLMGSSEYIEDFRRRALKPDAPMAKVGAENPDVYFQGRETVNKYYLATPEIVQKYMDRVAEKIGRPYHLYDYFGDPNAEKVIVAMGSACDTIEETINKLNKHGEKLGLIKVRLFRPFAYETFAKEMPASVKKVAVLDRTKEPGSIGEPLYMDVIAALKDRKDILIIGGRYGLSSKEFTPSMVKAVYDHLDDKAFHNFTVGIEDDVMGLSIPIKEHINTVPEGTISCKFWGFGSDGTVGANKNSIKIIGDNTDMYAQGYFQYDSKKSGGITRSHLRFGREKIQSEYLVENADFIACHNQAFIGRYDILEGIKENGVFLLNSNWKDEEVFENLTENMQKTIIEKNVQLYNIDALKIAQEVGLGTRINTVMMAAFFIISKVLPRDEAIKMIKNAIEKTYLKKGRDVVEMNWKAVDLADEALKQIKIPNKITKSAVVKDLVPSDADDFIKNVIEKIMREKGDEIKVSQMPFDGQIPTGTTALEKRGIAAQVCHWEPEKCIQCNQCSFVCPHAAIRTKLIDPEDLKHAPDTFNVMDVKGKDSNYKYKVQVYIEDCVGCGVCINECPTGSLTFSPIEKEREAGERVNAEFFNALPNDILGNNRETTVKGSQFKQPLFEFSGACAGCGETPYIKLITQLFGDRMIIANATGCSSIYGGTFPSIPYTKNKDGYGPAWANSLFEDNAEYGFGMRLAVDANRRQLKSNVQKLLDAGVDGELGDALKKAIENWTLVDSETKENAKKIKKLLPSYLKNAPADLKSLAQKVYELKDYFVDKSIWSFGGDGWAYDIGFGGLDHVLASGKNINILVLDTEVYSNTGGQASKASPLGAVARFAEAGKPTIKKDLGKMMMSYGYVYVAMVAMGANKNHLIKTLLEAEAYPGPSIVIAYAPCINHGIDMSESQIEEKKVVESGYWLLYRYNPALKQEGKNPFLLDSKEPKEDVINFLEGEKRYTSLEQTFPEKAKEYRKLFAQYVKERYESYRKMAEE
ncbi:MAG: pyruvate:ferredoxin (flavodoxin) oxidoreductase [Candidatus Marinimicrobia bacterium]|nr:pyruvate:ferredoxin (flavodoxin) oxidoreductase [Candidatus Neomarinimicrobiota bacterium]